MGGEFWGSVIEKGRISQWILSGGGIVLCIVGGTQGFLDGQTIGTIVLALVAAVFGIESINKQ